MGKRLTTEMVKSAASMIDLVVGDDEVELVRDRLQLLLDGTDQFEHLIENTAELDIRFNANWEQERA